MKVLALKKVSGSSFHRLLMPLTYLQVDFTDELTEDLIKKYEVLWLHYTADVHPSVIGYWKSKYNLKIVVDLDDSWHVSKKHVRYKQLQGTIQHSKSLVVVATHVICSTPQVEEMVKPYNSNTSVIGNGIPWNEGQYHVYQETIESFMNRKIRIGLVGSASHFEDWESIRGKMKRVLKDGEIKSKCEFVIGGYAPQNPVSKKLWDQVSTMLGKPVKVQNKEVYDYIDIYRNVDILLCPLVDNHANECRSNLKVHEAACVNAVCILGELYRDKSDYNTVHLFEDWYNNIKFLIKDKEELYKMKHQASQYIRDHHSYDEQCVQPRKQLLEQLTEEKSKEKELNIWGITYADGQFTEYNEYRNTVKTIEQGSMYFEYNAILNIRKQW